MKLLQSIMLTGAFAQSNSNEQYFNDRCYRDSPCNEKGTAGGNAEGCSVIETAPFFKCKCKNYFSGRNCGTYNCPCENGGQCAECYADDVWTNFCSLNFYTKLSARRHRLVYAKIRIKANFAKSALQTRRHLTTGRGRPGIKPAAMDLPGNSVLDTDTAQMARRTETQNAASEAVSKISGASK